jgi:hypothetical protein
MIVHFSDSRGSIANEKLMTKVGYKKHACQTPAVPVVQKGLVWMFDSWSHPLIERFQNGLRENNVFDSFNDQLSRYILAGNSVPFSGKRIIIFKHLRIMWDDSIIFLAVCKVKEWNTGTGAHEIVWFVEIEGRCSACSCICDDYNMNTKVGFDLHSMGQCHHRCKVRNVISHVRRATRQTQQTRRFLSWFPRQPEDRWQHPKCPGFGRDGTKTCDQKV